MANPKRSLKKSRKKSLKLFPYTQLIFSLLLIIFGGAVLLYAAFQKVSFHKPKSAIAQETKNAAAFSKPAKLYIPKMSKILYVSDGYVQGDRWVISETGVSYLTTSALPGQTGNAVIYGHNTKNILGGLWRVGDGDTIYVVLNSGDFVRYQVYERKEIEPTQVEILSQTSDSRLTIYTCSGFLDTARFVIVAKKA